MMKWIKTITCLLAAGIIITLPVGRFIYGQTGVPSPAPAPSDRVILAAPQWSQDGQSFSFPAAFWNEHLTDWLDVALCGRPSNFLHETVLSMQTTRSIMEDAFFKAGYHPANQWAPNLEDFVGIRGDPVLILVTFEQNGEKQTYLLDELIALGSWHISVGPFGWMFLGTSDPLDAQVKQSAAEAGKLEPEDAILMDDPQIAMQFRGIQHESQALLDHPLCFDDWIYPNIRYYRNEPLVPQAIFDSNGAVNVQVTFERVSEEEFLQATAKYWHDPQFSKFVLSELPIARQIDAARMELWKLVGQSSNSLKNWDSSDAQLYIAIIQSGYTTLDAAWIDWDYQHAQFSSADELTAQQVQQQALSFKNHMDQKREQYKQLLLAVNAHWNLERLMKGSLSLAPPEIAYWRADEIAARSQATLYSNQQYLDYWTEQLKQTPANDPRTAWLRDIHAQYALAIDRREMGESGLQFAAAIRSGDSTAIAVTQKEYLTAVLQVSLDTQTVVLVQLDFQITNQQGYAEPSQIAALKQQRQTVLDNIKKIQAQIDALKVGPATLPATNPAN
ncbi:MAG TPA: hypothetical protein VMG59_07925 [Phycisphaerae bacterium]|nr:hypothetical protein [Phycisphaerae bacterium]